MPRKKRQLDRDSGVVRDATLVVIASEDKYAVENYFQRFRTKKVQFRVLPTLDCNADPQSVLARIDEFRKSEEVEEHDAFWICIDSDHWADEGHLPNLVFCRLQRTRGTDRVRCNEAIAQLEVALGRRYHKEKCHRIKLDTSQVLEAIRRAKAMDIDDNIMPAQPSARIYKIVEMLQQRDSIDLRVNVLSRIRSTN